MITARAEVEQDDPSDSTAELWLPKSELSAPRARATLAQLLERVDGGERFMEAGSIVLAELVANASAHGTRRGDRFIVRLRVNPVRLRIEVHDRSTKEPVVRALAPMVENGRGMHLVSSLSQSWGCRLRTPGVGKAVWAVIHPTQGGC
ncbi:ATP-binding protein [Kitasatospora sp. RB6PN24]|uniref:ATP-binding protein n=1 Tax=Kitasatospora humi TaxID=2893891 RepID=UPI001E49943D|nr:ATP-binding protein [Kitasatospora humi]MCC9310712.1 ATP-binding protein [Kitasatospora humi]